MPAHCNPDHHGSTATAPIVPRLAASVVLLRDSPEGLQVLMQRRPNDAAVLGGIWVFPGGKVDATDCVGDSTANGLATLACAAVRELQEEAGVFLPDTSPHSLRPWARWVTPERPTMGSYRYDTQFFVAPMPTGQEAGCANHESEETRWISPRQALQSHDSGDFALMPPQYVMLLELAAHPDTASAWAHALMRTSWASQAILPTAGTTTCAVVVQMPAWLTAMPSIPTALRLQRQADYWHITACFETELYENSINVF
ncbi:NUDIX hydrolase [Curvibacter sp. CHRR-16]|uniref:NUDIX hydrolase n=1 Tax=Curvibacter sp. CHRR-16 TaxID=2835872 RepID=UPI001BDADF4B|nr:NUDIX hydrolase [Curvibacter sp. CHRR-16]MBT0571661.1 NUDIX hydrolase [Curvibacter sp. CHRR-16]